MKKRLALFALILSALAAQAMANIYLPSVFQDHMVLQRNAAVTVWGFAHAGEEIQVTPAWSGETVTLKTPPDGHWSLTLQTPDAGGPYTIEFQGYNHLTLNDVLIGEVWLCSGQSNMEMSVNWGQHGPKVDNGEAEKANADYPEIRIFQVPHFTAKTPQNNVIADWKLCTPDSMADSSAVAYFFARELYRELGVPVGLIEAAWGGTPIEIWAPAERINNDPALALEAAKITPVEWGPVTPGAAYNAMIYPVIPYKVRGALWYQGEANVENADSYDILLKALVDGWRAAWDDDFPFYYVQIAPWTYGGFQGARVRDAQRRALSLIDHSGMVVISDIGDINDIHPGNKLDVGKRLAAWALADTYHVSGAVPSGPLFREMNVEKNRIRISFDYAEGLTSTDGAPLGFFEIAGKDRCFYPATAVVENDTVLVSAPEVKHPVAVRFAYANTAVPNLTNATGLPASCFRTDDWPVE